MKRIIILLSVLVFYSGPSVSQTFSWVKSGTAAGVNWLARDKTLNFYTAAYPKISKYSAGGNFAWEKDVTGLGIRSMDCDSIGNVYVTGTFGGTVTLDGYTVTSWPGTNNMFLLKIDSSGTTQWLAQSWNNDFTGADAIAVNSQGYPVVAGRFLDSLQLDSFGFDAPATNQIFLAEYSPSGNCLWAKHLKSASFDGGAVGSKIKCDQNDNIYIAGHYFNWANFDSLNITVSGGSGKDIFLSKCDAAGNFQWAKSMGGTWWELIEAFDVDNTGNSYIGGYYESNPAYFDGFTLNTVSPGSDHFTAKYKPDGSCQWVKYGFAGNIAAVTADGYYSNSPSLITKFDSAGVQEWNKVITGSVSNNAMLVWEDTLFLGGTYTGTVYFDSCILSSSTNQMYLGKIGPSSLTTSIPEAAEIALEVYPNPARSTLFYKLEGRGPCRLQLYALTGQLLYEEELNPSSGSYTGELELGNYAKGLYYLRVSDQEGSTYKPVILN
jgi:hypothetical protein